MIENNGSQKEEIRYLTYGEALELVKDLTSEKLFSSPRVVRKYTEHLAKSRGKYIRAASLLACAMNDEGLVHPDAAHLAAAIEILHLATLVHDDVIDDADIRRGLPTVQKKFGKKTAVICGDYLLCVALKMAVSTDKGKEFPDIRMPDYVMKICSGELMQHLNAGNFELSPYEYLKIISGKTAELFEASFHAGAYLSGRSRSEITIYRRLGHYLGMIFQLTDDCLDFEAAEDDIGKPVLSDFEKNVMTLPIIHAFRKVAGLKDKAVKSGISANEILEGVKAAASLEYTRSVAKKYYAKYLKLLETLPAAECKKKILKELLDKSFRVFKGEQRA
ncbi:MAG: polyprenyl synthetase family protein [Bacillota bacterium]